MKVLIANKYFFRKGGSESVMFMERDYLRSANVEVVDFSMHDERNAPSDYAAHFVNHQRYDQAPASAGRRIAAAVQMIHSTEAIRRMDELIAKTQPDLLHCHNIYHQLTPSIIGVAKRHGLPVVLTLHDYKPVCPIYTRVRHGQLCSDCLDMSFFNVLRYRCADGSITKSAVLYAEAVFQRLLGHYEKVDAVIAPSEFMRASVTRARFPPNRVHVIYNGIDTAGIPLDYEDHGYALYLGRLSAEKGVATLLAAHSQFAADVPLHVAGTGPLEAELRQRFPRARYLGQLSGEPLREEVRKAAVVVVPSEWYENCPISVLEAMAYGKPVVGSEIGGIPELVLHGETGLLFPAGDGRRLAKALLRLMKDPALRVRYGAAGRARAERRFSLETHNRALERLYADVLDNSLKWRRQDPLACTSSIQE